MDRSGAGRLAITVSSKGEPCEKCGSRDTYDLIRENGAALRMCNRCLHMEPL